MCGIAGILAFEGALAVDESTVSRMTDTLRHRGPTTRGTCVRPDERVALGHRRLSIIDLSSAGHQPMANEDGTVWITYNGEVYNHASFARSSRRAGIDSGRPPTPRRSSTSTRTAGARASSGCAGCSPSRFGMRAGGRCCSSATGSVSSRSTTALLPHGLLFGSEVKAILAHPSAPRDLDEEAFADYLTFGFTPPPRTMFRGISKLGAGRVTDGDADGRRRASHVVGSDASGAVSAAVAEMSDAEMVAEVRARLRESVRKRMMSDVPFGVFLSGGLDSSTNVA